MFGFIFDLDGVLVDTVHYYYLATKEITDRMEVSFSEEDNYRYQGVPRLTLMKELARRSNKSYSEEELKSLGEVRNQYYQRYLSTLTKENMIPGAEEFLLAIYDRGYPIALASSSSNAHYVLEKLQIKHLFQAIIDPKKVQNGKPAPDIFLAAAKAINIAPENCFAFEDGEAGLTGILDTSMVAVGIGHEEHLSRANVHVKDFREITLEKLRKAME
ncbi:beta-phosphoglucomutase [Mangrovibacillus cuniculi]|uniref:Beta-phosphoglucomutase n=1 Tax=Mangrovibacillus cuniculi TaxID=2593652 RepID=A0A7S8HGU5_9BACI|nr:beta-phosphoglucomutase [Mangrovibacillus cuniculi]QPC47795.1 beta-phosphoglucomutase [Mangrovibacillus cuniculi]